ncbi:MAG: DUF177 domain-containing protein [Ignavibacteria bacterium]|nr:DUF177 domain-containing protein [Ignavibacteria bacterium]
MAIKINIGSLNEGSQTISLLSDENELSLPAGIIKGPLNIKLELFKTSSQLDVKAELKGINLLDCDRCLEKFEKDFLTSFELVFVMKSQREEEINEDYIRTYNPNMKSVDITNDLKEAVILTIPMKKLPEENSAGNCSWCNRTKDFWKGILSEKDPQDEF